MKSSGRAPRTLVSLESAEQSILYQLILTPALIGEVCAAVDLEVLTTQTAELVGLIAEYPALCSAVGVLAVADYLGVEEDLLDLILGLTYLPGWAVLTLPAWPAAFNLLADSFVLEGVGALEQWQSEVSRGIGGQRLDCPATWRFDSLWRAACYEAAAIESLRMGLRATAAEQMRQAIVVLSESLPRHEQAA